jgi:hypothetical protein
MQVTASLASGAAPARRAQGQPRMKSSTRQQPRNHALASLEYALLLMVIGALSLGLWTRVGRPLIQEWRDENTLTPPPH